jgi:hypothetical protein
MADYKRCKACGEWGWESHRCFEFDIRIIPERGKPYDWGDCDPVWARDEKAAAVRFADRWDEDDRDMMRGTMLTLEIQNGEGQVSRWVVWGEAVPTYHADVQPAASPTRPLKREGGER